MILAKKAEKVLPKSPALFYTIGNMYGKAALYEVTTKASFLDVEYALVVSCPRTNVFVLINDKCFFVYIPSASYDCEIKVLSNFHFRKLKDITFGLLN